jgi:hypothetical protein
MCTGALSELIPFLLTFEIFLSYKVYSRVLKWLTLSLLAYPLTVFIVVEPWSTILRATFLPHIEFNFQFLFIIKRTRKVSPSEKEIETFATTVAFFFTEGRN